LRKIGWYELKQEKSMAKQAQFWMALPLTFLLLSARAQDKAANKQTADVHASAPRGEAPHKPVTDDPNYVIGAQDVLDISVWKEAELSRSVPVRPDGKISLPLLNDVQAAGLTPSDLTAQITAGLNKFMTNPQVTVIVSQINSQRIYILGEVARAGSYTLLPDMTVLQALSDAGGFTAFANSKKVDVLRQDNGKQQKIPFNYKDVISGKNPGQNILLKPGDTIIVP
jgi:polysaccharide export outer membrane protein